MKNVLKRGLGQAARLGRKIAPLVVAVGVIQVVRRKCKRTRNLKKVRDCCLTMARLHTSAH